MFDERCPACGLPITEGSRFRSLYGEWWHRNCRRTWGRIREQQRLAWEARRGGGK